MYQLFFVRSVKTDEDSTNNISDETYGLMKELRGMLGISEEEGVGQIRNFFGPEVQIILTGATEEILRGNTTGVLLTNLKENVDKFINDYKLDKEMVHLYAGPLYNHAVEEIGSNTPGFISAVEEVETLSFL